MFPHPPASKPVSAEGAVHTAPGPDAEAWGPVVLVTFPVLGGCSEFHLWFTLAKRLGPPPVSFFLSNWTLTLHLKI